MQKHAEKPPKNLELEQLFCASAAHGTGVAGALLAAAERALAARGAAVAFLFVVVGNERAARFYTKVFWSLVWW